MEPLADASNMKLFHSHFPGKHGLGVSWLLWLRQTKYPYTYRQWILEHMLLENTRARLALLDTGSLVSKRHFRHRLALDTIHRLAVGIAYRSCQQTAGNVLQCANAHFCCQQKTYRRLEMNIRYTMAVDTGHRPSSGTVTS